MTTYAKGYAAKHRELKAQLDAARKRELELAYKVDVLSSERRNRTFDIVLGELLRGHGLGWKFGDESLRTPADYVKTAVIFAEESVKQL